MTAPPIWSAAPFLSFLLAITILPTAAPRFWSKNLNKGWVALLFAVPVALFLLWSVDGGSRLLFASLEEYAVFLALLASLFVISGNIHVRGSLAGTPLFNTILMGIGALLANLIGTTGASMLLIRPLLRANESRANRVHLVIFFIFIVSNAGGLLTPLGDPPLFLGFLRGVPFQWTLRLIGPWALVNGALLVAIRFVDGRMLEMERQERPGSPPGETLQVTEKFRLVGGINLILLLTFVAIIYVLGTFGARLSNSEGARKAIQIAGMMALAGISWATTRSGARNLNKFTWNPVIEVAVIFAGIFVTMVPALEILRLRGGELGVTKPWQYFWSTGILSSVLDNAPTYLVFFSLGQGSGVIPSDPAAIGSNVHLAAIACGAVFMGAMTYIGNGPNFMVKAIAEEHGVKMPGFFGYMVWSGAILIPLFVAVTLLFFGA